MYIRLADGRELSADPAELAFTTRAIFYRQYTLPLQNGRRQSLYAANEVESWLAPLLRHSQKWSEMQALKHR